MTKHGNFFLAFLSGQHRNAVSVFSDDIGNLAKIKFEIPGGIVTSCSDYSIKIFKSLYINNTVSE
ncbi:hypothetical protein D3C87_2088780 [compost metagenome]